MSLRHAATGQTGKKPFWCLLLLIPIGLAGCMPSHQELLQRDRGECAQFGFQPGTDRYSDCLLKLDAGRHTFHHH